MTTNVLFFLFIMCRKIKLLKKCTVIASSLKMLWGYWVYNGTWTQHCTWLLRLLVKRVSSTNPAVSMTDWICQTPSPPWPLALFSQTDMRLEEVQGRKTAARHRTPRRVWYLHDLESTTSAARHRQLCLTGLPQRNLPESFSATLRTSVISGWIQITVFLIWNSFWRNSFIWWHSNQMLTILKSFRWISLWAVTSTGTCFGLQPGEELSGKHRLPPTWPLGHNMNEV